MILNGLQIAILVIRASLAAVLVSAGAAKLADRRSFATTLRGLGVPARQKFLLRGLALVIPFLEVGVGLAVVSGLWPTAVNGAVLVFMFSFSLVVMVALHRKLHVTCRCFGTLSDSQFSGKGLARNVFLTVLAGVVFWSGITYAPRYYGPPIAITLLVAGFLLFALAAAQAAQAIAILKERRA